MTRECFKGEKKWSCVDKMFYNDVEWIFSKLKYNSWIYDRVQGYNKYWVHMGINNPHYEETWMNRIWIGIPTNIYPITESNIVFTDDYPAHYDPGIHYIIGLLPICDKFMAFKEEVDWLAKRMTKRYSIEQIMPIFISKLRFRAEKHNLDIKPVMQEMGRIYGWLEKDIQIKKKLAILNLPF
jgi:hypothetical protein